MVGYQCYAYRYCNTPAWRCVVATEIEGWNAEIPLGNPYTVVPLNSPQKLLDESLRMGGFKYQLQQLMFGSGFGKFHIH